MRPASLLIFMVLGFVLVWLGIVVLEWVAFESVDAIIAVGLNRLLVNQSSTLDLTLIYIAEDSGDLFATVILALAAARLLGLEKEHRVNVGNYAALAFYLAVVALLCYVLIEALDEVIRRDTPGTSLSGWKVPGALSGLEYGIRSRISFPSVRVTVFTALAFLVFFRFGFVALTLLLIPLALGVAWVATGQIWPTDTLGGFFFGWIVATIVYLVRGNRFYAWLDRNLERFQREQVRGRLARWIGRKIKTKSRSSKLADWDSQRRYRKGANVSSDAESVNIIKFVKTHYGFGEVAFLGTSHKGKVFPAECDGRRVAIKLSRLTETRRDMLLHAIHLIRSIGEENDLAFPEIINSVNGEPIVLYGEVYLYLIDWVEGNPANFSEPDHCRQVIRLLARLHAATEIPMDQTDLTIARIVDRESETLNEQIHGLRRDMRHLFRWILPSNSEFSSLGSLVSDAVRSELMARLALNYSADDPGTPMLCHIHGDTHPMNYLFDDEGRLHLLDLDYIRPDAAYLDLASPLGKVMRRYQWDERLFHSLLAEYTAIRPLPRWELTLLLARMIFPASVRKLLKTKRKFGILQKPSRRRALLKAKIEHRLLAGARRRFLVEVCTNYNLRLGLTILDREHFRDSDFLRDDLDALLTESPTTEDGIDQDLER